MSKPLANITTNEDESMTQIHAVVIGIEGYRDAFLKPVLFAGDDALAISDALVDLGCPSANLRLLLNEEATATAIESELRTTLGGLSSVDQCFIFFAGHGFSDGYQNYLAAHDTKTRDLEATSVRLQKVLGLVKASKSKKIVLFLDACHTGITVEETMRSAVLGIDKIEDEEFCAGFASCRADEKSYSSRNLKHGIWTHHLLDALTGRASSTLEGKQLAAMKLQQYLSDAVPRTIRKEFTPPPRQTPRFFGSFEGLPLIADLSSVLARADAQRAPKAIQLKRVAFVATETEKIRSLSGFDKRKGHFVPNTITSATLGFVNRLVSVDIESHVDAKYELIRKKMMIKANDVNATLGDGGATIRTPSFDYNITVAQIEGEPDSVLWRYELTNITDSSVFDNAGFNEVFRNAFDTVEFAFKGDGPDMRELVGVLEDAGYQVDCPKDFSYCRFTPNGADATVEVTSGVVNFMFARRQPPAQLASGFSATYSLLSVQPGCAALLSG